MIELIEVILGFAIIILSVASIVALMAFVGLILIQAGDWIIKNEIIENYLRNMFKRGGESDE